MNDNHSRAESLTVRLIAVRPSDVPADVDVDVIAESVAQAAFRAAYDGLLRAEGFERYGDLAPDESEFVLDLARLIVRASLANGRNPYGRTMPRPSDCPRATAGCNPSDLSFGGHPRTD